MNHTQTILELLFLRFNANKQNCLLFSIFKLNNIFNSLRLPFLRAFSYDIASNSVKAPSREFFLVMKNSKRDMSGSFNGRVDVRIREKLTGTADIKFPAFATNISNFSSTFDMKL